MRGVDAHPSCLLDARRALPSWAPRGRRFARALFTVLALLHAAGALYLSLAHQSGPTPAMALLASEAASGRVSGGGILMLTPCHETPGYSHLHARVPLRILDCSPRSDGALTQRDAFFAAPAAQLPGLLRGFDNSGSDAATLLDGGGVSWAARVGDVPLPVGRPSHIVAFDDVATLLAPMLQAEGYSLKQRFFHAHFAVDREQRALLVYAEREGGA